MINGLVVILAVLVLAVLLVGRLGIVRLIVGVTLEHRVAVFDLLVGLVDVVLEPTNVSAVYK